MRRIALTVALIMVTAASASAAELRDRHGKRIGELRKPTGPVMDHWTIKDRNGKTVGRVIPPSGPVMNHWTIKDRNGKTVGRVRCAPGKC